MVVKQLARGRHDVDRRVRLGYAAAAARGESAQIGRVLDDDQVDVAVGGHGAPRGRTEEDDQLGLDLLHDGGNHAGELVGVGSPVDELPLAAWTHRLESTTSSSRSPASGGRSHASDSTALHRATPPQPVVGVTGAPLDEQRSQVA